MNLASVIVALILVLKIFVEMELAVMSRIIIQYVHVTKVSEEILSSVVLLIPNQLKMKKIHANRTLVDLIHYVVKTTKDLYAHVWLICWANHLVVIQNVFLVKIVHNIKCVLIFVVRMHVAQIPVAEIVNAMLFPTLLFVLAKKAIKVMHLLNVLK
jgi:hypothetical protein